MSTPVAAAIDIGSNSIKVLVARTGEHGLPVALLSHTIEARISAGIGRAEPRLSEEGMKRGVDAITELLKQASAFHPNRVQLVATSAVRDARNGDDFRARVQAATGQTIRVLDGGTEANLIGCGITCDPDLRHLQDFYLFDLGGGSLESLAFRERTIRQTLSAPLGCVRLTERFVQDRSAPIPEETIERIRKYARSTLRQSKFAFDLPTKTPIVGTGGTMATVRSILAAQEGRNIHERDPFLPITSLEVMLDEMRRLDLEQRRKIPGLSAERADVFPAALATLIAMAEVGDFAGYHQSFHNLRYGLAAELLAR